MATATSGHAFGRDVLERVWPALFGAAPDAAVRQMVQAISAGEGGYGRATYRRLSIPDGAVVETVSDSNNWGAVQCASKAPCPAGCFTATDSSPRLQTSDNPKGLYQACFRRYASPDEGATEYLRTLLVRRPGVQAVIGSGSARAVASAMHASKYFEGFGATVADRVENYAKAIARNAQSIAAGLGEPLYVGLDAPAPTTPPPAHASSGGAGWLAGLVAVVVGVFAAARRRR